MAKAQKCAGVHTITKENSHQPPNPIWPAAAEAPTRGGIAPATPPKTIF